jgi:MFS family permease
VLVVVTTAYLADTVRSGGASLSAARVVILTAVMAGMMRPLGWVFAGGVAVVTCALVVRGVGWRQCVRSLGGVGLLTTVAVMLRALRDALLTGWILFPVSLFPVAVDWRLPDPDSAARDIQGWARTPFQPVQETLSSNSWLTGWLLRLPTDWSIPAVALLLVLALLVWARWRPGSSRWVRMALLTALPAGLALGVWMYSAPDPRFAWGYIVACGLVPLAFLTDRIGLRNLVAMSGVFLLGLLVLAGLRGSFGVWTWNAVEPPIPDVYRDTLDDGTMVLIPSIGDQCWSVYPLCRPDYAPDSVQRRGDGIASGFRPVTGAW